MLVRYANCESRASTISTAANAGSPLDTVSSNGTVTPYNPSGVSGGSLPGNPGSGISTGAIVPNIPDDAKPIPEPIVPDDAKPIPEQQSLLVRIIQAILKLFGR